MRRADKRTGVLTTVLLGVLALAALAAEPGERLAIGEFTATRFEKAPVIDGRVEPGEWDRALTTEGLMTPFEHLLQTAITSVSMGFDQERFYFLFRCRRGNYEWKLWKFARENDDYSFGEPSVEVWVTPPAMVPETYQSILNTYPAVFDVHFIPSRGYAAQGWRGDWKVGVTEDATNYVIEASVPFKDFGVPAVKSGDVWRFLLCRNALRAEPRSQASWSLTQGFTEIPQHPPVRLMDDDAVLQMAGTHTIFTGRYEFPITVVAPRGAAADVDVELRFQKAKSPGADDRVEKQHVTVAAGERKAVTFAGDVSEWTPAGAQGVKTGYFTVTGTKAGGAVVFRQSFAYTLNGWTPQPPARAAKDREVQELAIEANYGPETGSLLVKADIFDLPGRERAASGEVKVVEPANGKVLATSPMRPIRQWYSSAAVKLEGVDVPVADFRKLADHWAEVHRINDANSALKAENEKIEAANRRLKAGEAPQELLKKQPLPPAPPATAPRAVDVVVTVKDADGKELKTNKTSVNLLRYSAEWMNNDVGVTEQVIPPWSPVEAGKGGTVKVWNRELELDGLGLARRVQNGGVSQLTSMRLVAVKDGVESEIKPSAPSAKRSVPAWADYEGKAEAAGLNLVARTRVEFDGFVKVDLDLKPAGGKPAAVDKLYLDVVLPESEATHFCTTAGGWAAVHDVTPARWTSQVTASGMLAGDFVPYVWLSNTDRAFLWFADSDRGWSHDPEKKLPTLELVRENGQVRLRVCLLEIPTVVDAPRTITWGWQTFPSRPLPPGWRATLCAGNPPTPHTGHTYFWADADWAVLWPYYCSPFPWSLAKSKDILDRTPKDSPHRPSVGSIAHSIGRYRDYDGNEFAGLAVDWATSPGQIGNSDVTASKGPNDFRLWHYRRWVREAGFRSLYVDENYLGLEENYLTGNAYWRPDGGLQRAYNYLGLREYFKRLKVMFHQEGVPAPNLWQHISSGAAYHAWFGDIFFEGENVEPTDLNFDYIEVLPAGRLRAIGSSACAGGAMTMMCQSQRHRTQWADKHTHQFVGWVMAHDVLPEQVPLYPHLMEAGRLYRDDVRFLPYWKPSPFTTSVKDCLVSAHATPGRALLWVVNTSRADADVPVAVDWKAAGLDPAGTVAVDAETGAAVTLDKGGFAVKVLNRDFVPVLLAPRGPDGAAFAASFDQGVEAEQALYCSALTPARRGEALTLVDDGKGGKALALGGKAGVSVPTHLHLADAEGRLTFRGLVPADAGGTVLSLGPLSLQMTKGKDPQLTLALAPSAKDAQDGGSAAAALPAAGWHDFALSWDGKTAWLAVDGQGAAELPIRPLGLGLNLGTKQGPVDVVFSRLEAVDDIRCYRTAATR